MAKTQLRKITINELNPSNRPGVIAKTYSGYFHKWFDGLTENNNEPVQYAIVELETGEVKMFGLHLWSIKFIS